MNNTVNKGAVVCLGELLVRLSTPRQVRFKQANNLDVCFGGSEANVAASLSQFGVDTVFCTGVPNNDLGESAIGFLKRFGVTVHARFVEDSRMGLYFLEHGAGHRGPKVLYDRMNSAFSQLITSEWDWDEIYSGADWFHISGISPAVSENAANATLFALEKARRAGLTTSFDLNYRSQLWRYVCDPAEILRQHVDHVKVLIAGREDIQKCLNIDVNGSKDTDAYFETLAQKVMQEFPNIEHVAITIRETLTSNHHRWRAILVRGEKSVFSRQYDIEDIVDRVGAGDAFAAGLIYALRGCKPLEETIEVAAACAVHKHSVHGDVNIANLHDVYQLFSGVSARIDR